MTIAPRWPTASPPGTTSPGRRKPPEPRTSTAPEPPSALFPLHLKQVDKAVHSHRAPPFALASTVLALDRHGPHVPYLIAILADGPVRGELTGARSIDVRHSRPGVR